MTIPILLVLMGLLLQPTVILYDLCVMEQAAGETCRYAQTCTGGEEAAAAYAQHQLGAIPHLAIFHRGGSNWDIEVNADEDGATTVRIANECGTFPLLGIAAGLAGMGAQDGGISFEVERSSQVMPSWVAECEGSAADWISEWK